MENYTWQVISPIECEMAEKITTELIDKNLSIDEYIGIIMNIEQYIHSGNVDLRKTFSDGNECISNNIVSQIAYFLSEKLLLNGGNGVVLTSNILAEDMVRMSIIEWLHSNTYLNRETITDYEVLSSPSSSALFNLCTQNLTNDFPSLSQHSSSSRLIRRRSLPSTTLGKMLCEIAIGKEDKTVVVEDIQTLMGEFFDVKNKIISKYYAEYFSVKDKVVSLALSAVTQYMAEHDRYSMTWFELRTVIAKVLAEFGIQEKTAGFIKLLISENLLREADEKGAEITFAYQKFYEYLYAQKYLDVEVEIIVEAVENKKITLGTLEMIQILFLRNTKEELISRIDNRIHGEVVETFMSGLYWRNVNEINEKTIAEIEKLLSSSNESDMRRVILGLIAIATKKDCAINAYYVHKKLSNMSSYRRDFILSLFLLKQYDQVKIISDNIMEAGRY